MQHRWFSFGALTACASLVSATAAFAQDAYARTGFYLGVAGNAGIYTELDNTSGIDVDPAPGASVHAGYRFHPNFAGEAELEWIAPANVEGQFVPSSAQVDRTLTAMANVKGYMLTGRIQPFGVLGLGYMNTQIDGIGGEERQDAFAARLGGGFDLYATEHILGTIGASYVIPDDDLHDFAYVSVVVGLGYRF